MTSDKLIPLADTLLDDPDLFLRRPPPPALNNILVVVPPKLLTHDLPCVKKDVVMTNEYPAVSPADHSMLRQSPVSDVPGEPVGRQPFAFVDLETRFDHELDTLWTYMRQRCRPSFNPGLLADFAMWQNDICTARSCGTMPIRYVVLGSRFPGVFSLGGDLDLFAAHIRNGNRDALVAYGRACVSILHRNMRSLEQPIITIALVEGDALGGGFEALLSFNVVIAERGTKFGLPETNFGLFPGMGAHCFLSRRLGAARAEQMILSGRTYSAEELYELGIVHALADPGRGRDNVEAYIRHNRRRHNGHCAIYEASRSVNPLQLGELEAVVDLWADAALRLSEADLKLMRRLVGAQTRLLDKAA